MKLAEKRESERAQAEYACRSRGAAYESNSGRKFRALIDEEPKRDGKYIKGGGTQLVLDLCACDGKVPNRRAWSREAARASIEKRGADALEELGEAVPKRARSQWLVYQSMGGEKLATELHGLTQAEAEYVRSKSIGSHPSHHRIVVWPSQSAAPVQRIDHEDDIANSADLRNK